MLNRAFNMVAGIHLLLVSRISSTRFLSWILLLVGEQSLLSLFRMRYPLFS